VDGRGDDARDEIYRFGNHRLDVPARRLTRGGQPVPLAPRVFELLLVLVRSGGHARSRAELMDAVWGETIVEEGNLAWTIKELRRALGPEGPAAIETVRGYGYRFAAPLERSDPERPLAVAAPPAPPRPTQQHDPPPGERPPDLPAAAATTASSPASAGPPASPLPPAPNPPPATPAAEGAPRGHRGSSAGAASSTLARRWLVAGGLVAAAITLAVWGPWRSPQPAEQTAAAPAAAPSAATAAATAAPTATVLAVVPFTDLAADPASGWIAVAIAEVLTAELDARPRVTTLPGATIAQWLGAPAQPTPEPVAATLARELGAELVVAGSYLAPPSSPTLRIDAQLLEAASGRLRARASAAGDREELVALLATLADQLREALPHAEQPALAPPVRGPTRSAPPARRSPPTPRASGWPAPSATPRPRGH
jgi:DNA-binding winged helix-turn-helix (wHTH) protein/TolB-like protein